MGKSGVITEEFKGQENTAYHDIAALFKIYRSVNWRMQIKINQVRHRFQMEYGMDVDSFLDSIYQAGMNIDLDLAGEKERIEAINRSNKFLKLIDEAVELMRNYHPNGERYYWVLYYSYMSAYKAENVEEILDKLESYFPKLTRIHRATYFRWREQYFFNLRFDDTDSDHQKVCDFLNSCGRKKTRYIVKAFLAYWGMAGAKGPEEQRKETMEPKPPEEEHFVMVKANEYTADEAEVSLMRRNYQMFDDLGREELE